MVAVGMPIATLISFVRRDIGDPPENFQTNTLCDGTATWFDLPKTNINPTGLIVNVVSPSGTVTTLQTAPNGSDYTADYENGQLLLTVAPANSSTLLVTGQCWSLFTDSDLTQLCMDSVYQHCYQQYITERFRDNFGFITYRETAKNLNNIPQVEQPLLIMLSVINALWVLATDTASDVDIQTAEGTTINRAQRYTQIMGHIAELTQRYQDFCGELNVGLFRSETLNLRRVSKWTGRLVPIFRDREYDDHRWPVRELPQIDKRDEDQSGLPSPLWQSQGP
jgi:hypothetical protein